VQIITGRGYRLVALVVARPLIVRIGLTGGFWDCFNVGGASARRRDVISLESGIPNRIRCCGNRPTRQERTAPNIETVPDSYARSWPSDYREWSWRSWSWRWHCGPRTGFTQAFTHLTDRSARTTDFVLSLYAALLAEACNTGSEPFIRHDMLALRWDRIAWVKQKYLRDETITGGNATLVAAQNRIALAHAWGGGESPLPTACVSWCRSVPFTPVRIRSTSVRSGA
jgi:hypothetical protein